MLDQRRSVPAKQLGEPGPDAATLSRMLRSAVRVPDHGKRVPFRFLRIAGDTRHVLGAHLAAHALLRDPDASESALAKERARFAHAPLVLAVIAVLGEDGKVPEQERLLTAGCVCLNLLHAAQASGFGAQWLTGWPAYDPHVLALFGLGADERIVGFIHVGTARIEAPERERPDPDVLLADLQLARAADNRTMGGSA